MISYKNLIIFPTYHSNIDFSNELRQVFYEHSPDKIAVEFPANLGNTILKGIYRLPSISIIIYFDELLKEQLFIPIVPSDSLIEALRLAIEYGIQIDFIDLFVKNYNPRQYLLPDSYSLNLLTLTEFYQKIKEELKLDENLEQKNLLNSLRKISLSNAKLSVGSDAQDWLKKPEEIDTLRNYYMAAKLQELIDQNPNDKILVIIGIAHWEEIKYFLEKGDIVTDLTAFEIQVNAEIYNVLQNDLPKIMLETPNIVYQYEIFRKKQKDAIDDFSNFNNAHYELVKFDIRKAIKIIILRSVNQYKINYNEDIRLYKVKSLFQYIRNLPIVDNLITPKLFEIVLAAKSVINDDFAWIVWEECKYFPHAIEDPHLESLNFTNNGIFLHGKYFKLRRNIPLKIQKIKLPLKPKPKEKKEGDWLRAWNQKRWDLVSHLPEDLFEEDFFRHIRQRTLSILKNALTKVHKFNSTLMDGIDFRETIRNWPIEQQIYVKEEIILSGSIDTVVIIFDKDEGSFERYTHKMMWYAEHEQESDLAFFSSYPGLDLVGPGISRIELGGVTSFYPPRGIPNVWTKEFNDKYPIIKTKYEVLLMAALLFAQKKIIPYVAKEKPSNVFYQIAKKLGLSIHFISLDRFNPVSMRSLRNLHVLAGKSTRKIAHKYIKKRKI